MTERNKTVLITGGASGIGKAIAQAVLAEGWHAVVVDLSRDNLGRCREDLSGFGDRLVCEELDVTEEAAVGALIDDLEGDGRALTGVVNSAGIGEEIPALDTPAAVFRKILDVNLVGSFVVAREAAKRMMARGSGSIVNIASVSGLVGNAGRVAYGASKAGLINATKVMAVEWAKTGVRVNAIAPGPVETPMVAEMHSEAARRAWVTRVPEGRYATPEEMVGTAMFLLDDSKSRYITGQTIAVDGGMSTAGLMHLDAAGGADTASA
ncbi:MAG: SDR family NAD(P)-dependent oxidoreductase [Kiloniellales bacterium]|nr:SDR family NAD(P)-dependent oxidoreductase [Kiloniellales bacterium]